MRIVIISALIGGAILLVLFLWRRFIHVARPDIPPLVIEPDDPLMQEAVQQAKDSIPRFRKLAHQFDKVRVNKMCRTARPGRQIVAPG
jgi:hypothetical protein